MRIEILCTGDEILTGKTVNTNYSHIAQRLVDSGFTVDWGTTVGDDREHLLSAFNQAATRADAVIVNGGLGPTVDDLSQEVAATAAGVPLVLSEEWFTRMGEYFQRRGRVMPPNNRKQAMLPEGAELIDNPIGTACGFAVTIGRTRFFFTPGVPREMRRMLDEQLIPRLLKMSGMTAVTRLKRFHSFGIGEARADGIMSGIEDMVPDGTLKLGFQTHYPQLETKLAIRGADAADIERKLSPVVAEVRSRLGNFIIAEDEQTLEGVIVDALHERAATLSIAEMFTGGRIASRIAPLESGASVFRRGLIARDFTHLCEAAGLNTPGNPVSISTEAARGVASSLLAHSGSDYALTVLIDLDDGPDRIEFGGMVCIGIADADGVVSRHARLVGGRDWVLRGAAELGLDCLRRHLFGLPLDERIDFEKR